MRITLRLSVTLILVLIFLALGHIRWGLFQQAIDSKNDVSLDLAGWEAIPEMVRILVNQAMDEERAQSGISVKTENRTGVSYGIKRASMCFAGCELSALMI